MELNFNYKKHICISSSAFPLSLGLSRKTLKIQSNQIPPLFLQITRLIGFVSHSSMQPSDEHFSHFQFYVLLSVWFLIYLLSYRNF